jgi:hypothetical protein
MSEQKQAPQYEYEKVITADGSPSVRMGSPTQVPEVMHHSGGALTESVFIYLAAVERAVELGLPPKILSVGLGIGYNEALAAGHLLKLNRCEELHIASFEIDPVLKAHYVGWLLAKQNDLPPVNVDLGAIFSEVLAHVARHLSLVANDLQSALAKCFLDGRFNIYGALEQRPTLDQQYTCILFDAFSKKATPDLWQEQFLKQFLADACAPECVLATYAATGNLNRALRASGFTLVPRTGFQGKRESTWAERHL